MESSSMKPFEVKVNLAERSHKLKVIGGETKLSSVMSDLESAFQVKMRDHCLTYIDGDKEYIIMKDEDEWQLYQEEYYSGTLCDTYQDQVFIFRDNEVLTNKAISDMIGQSLASSFTEMGDKCVAEIHMDEEMRSQIAAEMASNSAFLTPALRSRISFTDEWMDGFEIKEAVNQSLKSIIEEKVKAGEIQMSRTPIASSTSVLQSATCSNCSKSFAPNEVFYLDAENSQIKVCGSCKDQEMFIGRTLFTCVPGVKPAVMSEDGFEVVNRPPVAVETPELSDSTAAQDYSLPEFPIRLVFTQIKHNHEEHRTKVEKLKRKGVKFIKKEVKKIGIIGKCLLKGVKKLFEG